jgi:hypothetical protein
MIEGMWGNGNRRRWARVSSLKFDSHMFGADWPIIDFTVASYFYLRQKVSETLVPSDLMIAIT